MLKTLIFKVFKNSMLTMVKLIAITKVIAVAVVAAAAAAATTTILNFTTKETKIKYETILLIRIRS